MSRPPGRQDAPSWLATVIVAVALIVMCLRAAAQLRRSISRDEGADAGADAGAR